MTDNIEIKAVFSRELKSYTVYWKNYNRNVLETDNTVNYGTTTSYDGPTPTQEASVQYTFIFIGWNTDENATEAQLIGNTSEIIEGETTYYAIYSHADREYPAEIQISYDGDDIFGTVLQKTEGTELYNININNGDNISIKYDASVEVQSNGVIVIEGLQPFKAVAKAAEGNYTYTFKYWQINELINFSYDSENSENNILSMESKILTSIKAVFERESLVKENNGTLVLKIDGENIASPYTYAGESYTLSATGNKGTAQNTFAVVNGTGQATISENILTVTKAGTLTIKVNNAGDGSYLAATELSVNIEIKKGNPGLSYAETILYKAKASGSFINPLTNPYGLTVTYSKNSIVNSDYIFTVNATTGSVYIADDTTAGLGVKAEFNENDLWEDDMANYGLIVVPEITLYITNGEYGMTNTYEDWKENNEVEEYEGNPFFLTTKNSSSISSVVFSVAEGGTGEATISGNILTLTKAGTIILKVAVESNTCSDYIQEYTITFNKGIIGAWNEDIQIGGVSLYDYDEEAYITTQSSNFTAVAAVYDTTTQIPATYSSSDTSIATVNETTGEVTILGTTGQTVEITATINFVDNDLWKDCENYTLSYLLTISE